MAKEGQQQVTAAVVVAMLFAHFVLVILIASGQFELMSNCQQDGPLSNLVGAMSLVGVVVGCVSLVVLWTRWGKFGTAYLAGVGVVILVLTIIAFYGAAAGSAFGKWSCDQDNKTSAEMVYILGFAGAALIFLMMTWLGRAIDKAAASFKELRAEAEKYKIEAENAKSRQEALGTLLASLG